MAKANACASCGALVDVVKHVRCMACKTPIDKTTVQAPIQTHRFTPAEATESPLPQSTLVTWFGLDGSEITTAPVNEDYLMLNHGTGRISRYNHRLGRPQLICTHTPGDLSYPVFAYEYLT